MCMCLVNFDAFKHCWVNVSTDRGSFVSRQIQLPQSRYRLCHRLFTSAKCNNRNTAAMTRPFEIWQGCRAIWQGCELCIFLTWPAPGLKFSLIMLLSKGTGSGPPYEYRMPPSTKSTIDSPGQYCVPRLALQDIHKCVSHQLPFENLWLKVAGIDPRMFCMLTTGSTTELRLFSWASLKS